MLRRGETPVYKKKCERLIVFIIFSLNYVFFAAERKIEQLVEKYEELKKTNKLQKYLERRSKKQARKEFKKLLKQPVM